MKYLLILAALWTAISAMAFDHIQGQRFTAVATIGERHIVGTFNLVCGATLESCTYEQLNDEPFVEKTKAEHPEDTRRRMWIVDEKGELR